MAMIDDLAEVFSAFAAGAEMDGRAFTKCLRDADLLDRKLSATDVDLVFTKCKAKGKRKIDLATFRKALGLIATRKGCTEDEVIREVSQTAGPAYRSVADKARSRGNGPERLFYDRKAYTGTHRNGGPSTLGGSSIIGVEDLVNRDLILADGVQRRKSIIERSSSTSSIALSTSQLLQSSSGPERFFFDRSTYTGTHRNGGPSLVGSGGAAPKEPYAELSALVNRNHVQDDALHRQKSSPKRPALSLYPEMSQSQPLPVLLGGRSTKASDKEFKEGKIDKEPEDDRAASAMPILSGHRQAYASLSAEKPMINPLNAKAMPALGRLPARLTMLPASAQLAPCTASPPAAMSVETLTPLTLSPLSHRSKPAQVPALVLSPVKSLMSL